MAATARRSSSRSKGFSMQGWLDDAQDGLQAGGAELRHLDERGRVAEARVGERLKLGLAVDDLRRRLAATRGGLQRQAAAGY